MIPIDRYNKDFDMFLLGNLGAKDVNSQISRLEAEDDIMVLIALDEKLFNWQHPKDITDCIEENWKNIGQIYMFNAYVKEEK